MATLKGSSIPRAAQIVIDPIEGLPSSFASIGTSTRGSREGMAADVRRAGVTSTASTLSSSVAASSSSFPFIVGGGATIDYPAVAAILYRDDGGGLSTGCTGTLIAINAVLTAAHCASGDLGLPSKVAFQHGGLHEVDPAKIAVFESFQFPYGDLAILFLKTSVRDVQAAILNTVGRVASGSPGRIVGFGYHRSSTQIASNTMIAPLQPAGIKLHANVSTNACPTGSPKSLICWTYVQGPALALKGSTCHGDSGGPLFINLSGKYYLSGLTSGGVTCAPGDKAYDTEVFDFATWIKAKLSSNPPTVTPGQLKYEPLPAVVSGHDWQYLSPVSVIDFQLDTGDGSFYRSFEVPSKVELLRLQVNTVPAIGSTLRLEVGYTGASPSCVQEDYTTVLVCDLLEPGEGSWHAKIAGRPGQEFQAVATQFPSR